MSFTWMAAGVASAGVLTVLVFRAKLKRDAVRQDGQVVGSALYGGEGRDGQVLFVMLRGEQSFRTDPPFE